MHIFFFIIRFMQNCNLYYIQIMNITNINTELKFVNKIGQTLSTQERLQLQVSVLKLSSEYHYEVFNFWGRIQGVLKNYYIVEGLKFKDAVGFPIKKFFWSSEDFKFAELPIPKTSFITKVYQLDDYFTGQHEKILFKITSENQPLNFGGQDYRLGHKNFTQLDRLSIVVNEIQHDCQVVPVGAFKMIPTHEIVKNPNFRGLKIQQSKNLDNYVHFRFPEDPDKVLIVESDKSLQRQDFLDPLSKDAMKKSWSLQTDESKTQITLRSLIWPGFVGYHRTNSNIYGGVYMGNGIKSQDFPFLV